MHLHCKSCGETIHGDDVNVANAIAKCRSCHAVFGFADQLQNTVDGIPERRREAVPMPDRIHVQDGGGDLVITRRWFSPTAFFLIFFCIFWNGFLVFWYSIAFSQNAPLIMKLFPLLHVGVGVGLTYFTLATFLNTTTIRVTSNELSVRHRPLPWPGNRAIQSLDLKQLYCTEHYRRSRHGGRYTFQLNAALTDGSKVKLLSGLPDADQVLYIEQEVERFLGIADRPVAGEMRE